MSNEIINETSSYILTAESYWESAKNSSIKTSPLGYYYCFMNLIKTLLILQNKNADYFNGTRKPYHGLSHKDYKESIQDAMLTIKNSEEDINIAPQYFHIIQPEVSMRHDIRLSMILKNLQYCRTEAPNNTGIGSVATCFRVVGDKSEYWSLVCIPKYAEDHMNNHPRSKTISKYFESKEITSINDLLMKAFDYIPVENFKSYYLLESRQTSAIDDAEIGIKSLIMDLNRAFGKHLTPNYYGTSQTINININDINISEEASAYMVFFYLSNLVRYNPKSLLKLENGIYWPFIQSFVNEYSIYLLKCLSSRIASCSRNKNAIFKFMSV